MIQCNINDGRKLKGEEEEMKNWEKQT